MSKLAGDIDLKHHAYCIIGGEVERAELLEMLEREHGVSVTGNPDLFNEAYETFAIDDARHLKGRAETRPATDDGKKIFIIKANNIAREAQNALLKLLEEPPRAAHFFLIVPSAHLLLPTIKSRLLVVGGGVDSSGSELAQEFLKTPPTKRMDWIKSFMEEVNKEKRPKHDAVELLKGLEAALARKSGGDPKALARDRSSLEAIMLAEKYSTDHAPSIKMLLEYVAMNL